MGIIVITSFVNDDVKTWVFGEVCVSEPRQKKMYVRVGKA